MTESWCFPRSFMVSPPVWTQLAVVWFLIIPFAHVWHGTCKKTHDHTLFQAPAKVYRFLELLGWTPMCSFIISTFCLHSYFQWYPTKWYNIKYWDLQSYVQQHRELKKMGYVKCNFQIVPMTSMGIWYKMMKLDEIQQAAVPQWLKPTPLHFPAPRDCAHDLGAGRPWKVRKCICVY
jgi:hypothetical protein